MSEMTLNDLMLAHIQMHKAIGINVAQLIEATGKTEQEVRRAIWRLTQQHKIKHGLRTSKCVLWIPFDAPVLIRKAEPVKAPSTAHLHRKVTGLTTPKNGPGHTQKALPVLDKPTNVPMRNGTMQPGQWVPPRMECTRPEGTAFLHLKSVDNGREIDRKPPMLICVGVRDNGPMNVGRPRRLA